MIPDIKLIKGLHPGIFLERELKKRGLVKSKFALSINEYPQLLGDITKAKRRMNVPLAMKIEKALGLEEGYLMTLQVHHDIKEEKTRQHKDIKPDLSKIRRVLFWDTKMDKIDWVEHKQAVVQRVTERGNDREKAEIERFYNTDKLKALAE